MTNHELQIMLSTFPPEAKVLWASQPDNGGPVTNVFLDFMGDIVIGRTDPEQWNQSPLKNSN
jgi:hypothetical protein